MCTLFKQLVLVATLGAGLGLSSQAWSAPTLTGNLQQDMEITRSQILDPNLHAKLKENLSEEDYQNWSANLKEMGNPIDLGNGSIYYEAFKDENLDTASGIVLNDNGLFYLMYKHPTTNKLVYVSNDATCSNGSHFMTLSFAKGQNIQGIDKKQSKEMQSVQHNCEQIYLSPTQMQMRNGTKPDLLPKAEADNLRKTAVAIWGSQASSWTMNRSLADVTAKAVIDIKDCSNTMSFVPSPVGVTKPTYSYIRNQITKIVSSLLGVKKTDKQNYACIKSVALKTRHLAQLTQ